MTIRDNASVIFSVPNYQNCNMSYFIVECKNTKTDDIFKLPCKGDVENCTTNSIIGQDSYKCRARVGLTGKYTVS